MIKFWVPDKELPMEVTEADAIKQMQEKAAEKCFVYPSDEEALIDFIVVHWAWRE